jgi:phosphate transport system substrate-binding protein
MKAAADSFMAIYPGAQIHVEGGGSVAGLEALLNAEADLAVVSRDPTPRERAVAKDVGVEVTIYPFARDGLAIIVHRDSKVFALAFDEARSIFTGERSDWGDLGGDSGPIAVYRTGESSGATEFVAQALLGGAPFAADATVVPTTAAAAVAVAADPRGIGFAGMTELGGGVKAVPISSAEGPLTVLNAETVHRETYPLARTLAFAARGIPRDNLVSGFVSFVTSTRGQSIVLESGLVPATVPLRIRHEGER